jgi:membrane protein
MAVSYGSIYLCSTIVYVYFMLRFFPFIKRLFQEFIHDNCMIRASNLTFISLIAVVPLSAIVISLFSIFGITEQLFINLQKYLFIQSFPTLHEEIVANLEKFIGNARSIGVVGALFFIIPSILLLNNINTNFNAVWGSPSRETVLEKFITYVSVILVGTVLILAGFSFSYILGTTSEFIEHNKYSFTAVVIQHILPRLMSFLTFFLIIMLVPNGRVRPASGLVGALTGTICWEIAKVLFIFATTQLLQMSAVYGPLAAIPLFLIWLYTAWGIVLYALESAFVYQHRGKKWIGKSHERLMPAGQIYLGLKVFLYIANAYRSRGAPPSRRNLSENLHLSENEIEYIVRLFLEHNLIIRVASVYPRYMPAGPLDSISAADVLAAVIGDITSLEEAELHPLSKQTVREFMKKGKDSVDYSIQHLLKGDLP